jgi:DNA repair exonuclease SbcCD ATPase subunit
MKRILLSLCVAMALPAMAQSQPAKPASAKKAPAKPKIVIMTRDELRACFKQQAANSAENIVIDKEKEAFQQERNDIVADKEALLKQSIELNNLAKALEAEATKLLEAQKEFEQPVPKAEVKAAEARRVEFNDRVTAHQRKVDTYNTDKNPFNKAKDALDARIEANNARGKALQARTEQYNDAVDEWKASCSNKPYDTTDEAAVKKELKAAEQQ